MTLRTELRILTPMNPETIWATAIEGTDPIIEEWDGCAFKNVAMLDGDAERWQGVRTRMTIPGQGLDAWVIIRWGLDGPYRGYDDGGPDCAISISWDTAYGGESRRGETATEYHARMINEVLDALPDTVRYAWENEYTGEWTCDARPGPELKPIAA